MADECFAQAMVYEFDVCGHTIVRCKGGLYGASRKLCPHYGGKCPAVRNGEKK